MSATWRRIYIALAVWRAWGEKTGPTIVQWCALKAAQATADDLVAIGVDPDASWPERSYPSLVESTASDFPDGYNEYYAMTYTEIAERLGVSKHRVSQIAEGAMKKLRLGVDGRLLRQLYFGDLP